MKTVSGEGPSAREALEALALSLRDDEVPCTVHVHRGTVEAFGRQLAYEGFIATVDRTEHSQECDLVLYAECSCGAWDV